MWIPRRATIASTLIWTFAGQAAARTLPTILPSKEQLANDNNLFISLRQRSGLRRREGCQPPPSATLESGLAHWRKRLLHPFFQHVFGKAPDMQAVVTAPDLRILIGMALAGTGWTVLSDYLCVEGLATGQLVELPTTRPGPDNTLYLVWNKTALRHPRVIYVRDFLLRAV